MAAKLNVYGFETSNNMKVRVALGYKRLEYAFHNVNPATDREKVVALSGQHLTPVLQHGETVLFDSAAILRYLDAQFRETPRLFGETQAEQWEIEDLEFFARVVLAGPMMRVVHKAVLGEEPDEQLLKVSAHQAQQAVSELGRRLGGRDYLVGDKMSAADIAAACTIHRIRKGQIFPIEEQVEGLGDWLDRVMDYDPFYRMG